jgi:hypothetical protein
MTATKPYAPNHLVYIGVVVRANNGNGILYVRAQNGYELDEIHDVDLVTTPPSSGDFLKYNGTLWVNDPINLGTDTTGNYMSDISGTSPVSVSHTPAEGSSATVALSSGYGDAQNPYASKTANYVLASPNGSAGAPSFRAMVNADVPSALTSKTYNGLTVTSTTGTFTLTNAKTLSVTNTLTLSGTDSTTMTFPATSSTVMTLANPGTLTGTLTLRAGTATAGTAPLYLTSGTNLTTAAAGAMEFDGTNLYFSPSTTRKTVAFTDSNITGTASNITASSNTSLTSLANLATVGTITGGTWSGSFGAVSGANLTNLTATNLTGTIASARLSGGYTGITAVGTLVSLTVDGASSAAFTLGDWTTNGTYGGVIGNAGYLLVGNTVSDAEMYLRTSSTGRVRIGANGQDTLIVGDGSTTATSVTGILTTGNIWNTSVATTTLTGFNYVVRSTGSFPAYYHYTSNRDSKRNIVTITDSGSLIDQLNPVTYQAKIDETDDELSTYWKDHDLEYGFIAEEVAEVGTGFLAQYRDNGNGGLEPAGWKFHGVVSVLVAEVKDLRKRIAELESTK